MLIQVTGLLLYYYKNCELRRNFINLSPFNYFLYFNQSLIYESLQMIEIGKKREREKGNDKKKRWPSISIYVLNHDFFSYKSNPLLRISSNYKRTLAVNTYWSKRPSMFRLSPLEFPGEVPETKIMCLL